jgi:hypothetical protein
MTESSGLCQRWNLHRDPVWDYTLEELYFQEVNKNMNPNGKSQIFGHQRPLVPHRDNILWLPILRRLGLRQPRR